MSDEELVSDQPPVNDRVISSDDDEDMSSQKSNFSAPISRTDSNTSFDMNKFVLGDAVKDLDE